MRGITCKAVLINETLSMSIVINETLPDELCENIEKRVKALASQLQISNHPHQTLRLSGLAKYHVRSFGMAVGALTSGEDLSR